MQAARKDSCPSRPPMEVMVFCCSRKSIANRVGQICSAIAVAVGLMGGPHVAAIAQGRESPGSGAGSKTRVYSPIQLQTGQSLSDRLSNQDIPTGQSGFARDYIVQLQEGSQIAIDLTSENFDTIVSLLGSDGATVAENDDGPDGSTNSLLFTRITKSGTYYIRVRAFGELADGKFKLKLSTLQSR
jgi:hypothetical protein